MASVLARRRHAALFRTNMTIMHVEHGPVGATAAGCLNRQTLLDMAVRFQASVRTRFARTCA